MARKPKRSSCLNGCVVQLLVAIGVVYLVGLIADKIAIGPSTGGNSTEKSERPSSAVASMDALTQASWAFDGGFTRDQIKTRMDQAFDIYQMERTEDNYSRSGSVLVALRKKTGFSEMTILDHMIRSHVPGVKIDFASAAALSASFLAAGDK
jgi:hypothetical protein